MKRNQADVTESREFLLSTLKAGDTVYGIVTHVSRSGMSRRIKFLTIKDNQPMLLSYHIAAALEMGEMDNNGALRVNGCGMDMIFHVVSRLSRNLWPNAERCDYLLKSQQL